MGNLKSSAGHAILITMAFPLVREPGKERWQLPFGNTVLF
jgi:hypothetical protein